MNANSLTRFVGLTKATLYKNRGTIAYVGGTILTMVGTGLFVKQTLKFSKRLDEHKKEMEELDQRIKDDDVQVEESVLKKEKRDICKKTVKEAMKVYAVPTAVSGLGYGLSIAGVGSIHSDLTKVSVALNGLTAAYEGIKAKVIEKEGVEKWNEYAYDDAFTTVTEVDEEGVVTESKAQTGEFNDMFAEFFEESNVYFSERKGANKDYIIMTEQWANDTLERRGVLMYHEVLRELGMTDPKLYLREETCKAGWRYDKSNTHQIDFGLRIDDPATKRFWDEDENVVLLRFNPVPNVYDYI